MLGACVTQMFFTTTISRLHERLQECNGDEVLKAEAGAKVQKFTEWALKCIGFHSRCQGNRDRVGHNPAVEIQLQLSAFKTFLDLAGNHLTGKDFTEAFDAACFPLTLFSSSFDPGWASGISATAIQGLLGMLVEGGADNVNQCFLEASRFGSTELVRILLQVCKRLLFMLLLLPLERCIVSFYFLVYLQDQLLFCSFFILTTVVTEPICTHFFR